MKKVFRKLVVLMLAALTVCSLCMFSACHHGYEGTYKFVSMTDGENVYAVGDEFGGQVLTADFVNVLVTQSYPSKQNNDTFTVEIKYDYTIILSGRWEKAGGDNPEDLHYGYTKIGGEDIRYSIHFSGNTIVVDGETFLEGYTITLTKIINKA